MSWYRMKAGNRPEAAEIWLYGEIGAGGVTAMTFIEELKALGEVSKLTIHVNSPGGMVMDGLGIFNALKAHPAHKTGIVEGVAASMASMILMVCDAVVMAENSLLMIHDPATMAAGTAEDLRKSADVLDKLKLSAIAAYRDKSALPESEIAAIMAAETWFTAAEAKEKGFCDVVGLPVEATAHFDLSKFRGAPTMRAPVKTAAADALAVIEMCQQAGFPQMAAGFVTAGATRAVIETRLREAGEIARMCDLTNTPPAMRAALVEGGSSLEAARTIVAEHRAALDGTVHTDTAHHGNNRHRPEMIDHRAVYSNLNARKP